MFRRAVVGNVLFLAISAAMFSWGAAKAMAQAPPVPGDSSPRFRADGRDAEAYGRNRGYPSCDGLTYLRDQGCRVGAFSHFDTLFRSRTIAASASASPLRRAASEPSIDYTYAERRLTLDQYLDAQPVTGFLIAKGDTILVERYQYGRTDKHRLTSFSMAKTVIALLIGIAVDEGAIRSVDDLAEVYVPGLKDTEYGRTPIKALLQMASGVSFREDYADTTSDIYTLANLTLGQDPGGSLAALKRFNTRDAQPGQRFSYSSAESTVLGLIVSGATGRTVSDYASEKLWKPLGAEADATWVIDAKGQEITFAYVNAVLRDWARLGLMLAHDGIWQGKRIVSREWILASTSIGPGSPFWSSSIKAGAHTPRYGYQTWLLMADRRTFALRGLRGQYVLVDPESKLVLVQTAVFGGLGEPEQQLYALWSALSSQLR